MARNSTFIAAPPAAVWSVLEDPFAYPRWIVGSDRTLSADETWPAPGSEFRVRLAVGVRDRTRSRALEPGRRLVLDAATGLFGPTRVIITTEPRANGTWLTMVEDPVGRLGLLRYVPAVQIALRLRNVESLRRLRGLVEGRRPRSPAGQ